jgi:phosphotransacetylase
MSTAKKEEKKLTKAEIEEKAIELAKAFGVHKIIPIVFVEGGEEIVGFMKEPSRQAKIAVMDKALMGGYSAAEEILRDLVLKDHSDPRILSDAPEHDKFYLGAVMVVYEQIKFSANTLKKK